MGEIQGWTESVTVSRVRVLVDGRERWVPRSVGSFEALREALGGREGQRVLWESAVFGVMEMKLVLRWRFEPGQRYRLLNPPLEVDHYAEEASWGKPQDQAEWGRVWTGDGEGGGGGVL